MQKKSNKVMLIILDGWGIAKDKTVSAIDNAGDLYFHSLMKKHPNSQLITYGTEVGLPEGQMGNSEVGHLNIGAGRIVYQEFQRINNAIETGEFQKNKNLNLLFEYCKKEDKPLHLIGLYSDGGVHSHSRHFWEAIHSAESFGLKNIKVHAFTDGRDCDPQSSKDLIRDLQGFLKNKKAKLASICGRYYAMDRDKRWERVRLAYDMLVYGKGEKTNTPIKTIEKRYISGETDEFMKPMITTDFQAIQEGDAVLCLNFRTDRCREITEVLTQKEYAEYGMKPLSLKYMTMTEYSENFNDVAVLFYQNNLENTIGEVLAQHGKSQLRVAETEKYPHVTFFFSGGREQVFEKENRLLKPSPKVATYDLQPEMSAYKIKEDLQKTLENEAYDFIIVNFANTDMVGHTGVMEAAIGAVQAVDSCIEDLIPLALTKEYEIIVIADHGNSDIMTNPNGSPNTAHTMNPVPCILISEKKNYKIQHGKLADIAPTILELMDIDQPHEMTGKSLIKH